MVLDTARLIKWDEELRLILPLITFLSSIISQNIQPLSMIFAHTCYRFICKIYGIRHDPIKTWDQSNIKIRIAETYSFGYTFKITKAFFFTNKILSAIENNIYTTDSNGTNLSNCPTFFVFHKIVLKRERESKIEDDIANATLLWRICFSSSRISYAKSD